MEYEMSQRCGHTCKIYHKLWHISSPFKPEKSLKEIIMRGLNSKSLPLVDHFVVKNWILILSYKSKFFKFKQSTYMQQFMVLLFLT